MDKFGAVEDFRPLLVQKEALDDASLLAWLNEHPKNFAPQEDQDPRRPSGSTPRATGSA